jgi:gliding motility-associated-like protein
LRFIFFFLLLISSLTASAATFIVTSNADSGPGTLRQALTDAAANGNVEMDYINFNIADVSEAGRTITTQTQLPDVSSNLVIDGSTQPGSKLGASDAKVFITVNRLAFVFQYHSYVATLLIRNQTNIEIYGLKINGFYDLGAAAGLYAGIIIAGSQTIQIGAQGKGNWLNNNDYAIVSTSFQASDNNALSDIRIQSNYIGYDEANISYPTEGISLIAKNITFGGSSPADGNHIAAPFNSTGDNLKISNNTIGIDGNGDVNKYYLPIFKCNNANNVEISYNTCALFRFNLTGVTNFKVFSNQDISLNYPSPGSLWSLALVNCSDGVIGSDDEIFKNTFVSNTGSGPNYISWAITNQSSSNIQILKNEFVCSRFTYAIYQNYPQDNNAIPQIQVVINNDTEYSGTASPNSTVYIYYDDSDCLTCSPLKFYTKVIADANGQWKITGNFTGKRWVANALLIKTSSQFTQPFFDVSKGCYKYTQPSCGQNNGTIEIINYANVLRTEWYNASNVKVAEGTKVENLGPGNYYAIIYNGNCSLKAPQVCGLYDARPVIVDQYVVKKNISCGNNNGSVTGLIAYNGAQDNPTTTTWTDEANHVVSTNTTLDKVGPGTYTFTITDKVNGCTATYGPITLINTSGPNIDQTKIVITPSPCGQAQGSITNIIATGTGTLKYSWKNGQNQEVATTKDLINLPAGKYVLVVTDETACGGVLSTPIEIPEVNGITIDDSQITITAATCRGADGTIKNLITSNATTYNWYDANNHLVGTTSNLTNAAPGTYHLVASNGTCSKTSSNYIISQLSNVSNYTASSETIVDETCSSKNGSIQIIFASTSAMPKTYRWQNASGNTIGNTNTLNNLEGGNYTLFVSDENGCEKLFKTYLVLDVIGLTVNTDNLKITDDNCNTHTGSITGLLASGHLVLNFKWTDDQGNTIAYSPDIKNLGSGHYHIAVSDAQCTQYFDYTVNNQTDNIPLPTAPDIQLCTSGDAILPVIVASSKYSYRLYNNSSDAAPIDDQKSGRFKINVLANRSYYVSQYYGQCESNRIEVQVKISLSKLKIPNVITPNNDGINDTWKLDALQSYPSAQVQLYNRYGQKVFESKGYSTPFDGTMNGSALATGTYYYIINLNAGCDLLSGSLTIIR